MSGSGRGTRRPISILIVDDSSTMRAMLKRVVELSGIEVAAVHEAADGNEAIAVLEREPVDALFTDINMPGMSGIDLLRRLARDERWSHLLRVVISTDGSASRRAEAGGLDVRLYLEKPLRPEVMRDVLAGIAAAHA
ncbi:MAG TPA: response regulator [Vicinamibacterales bacterium]